MGELDGPAALALRHFGPAQLESRNARENPGPTRGIQASKNRRLTIDRERSFPTAFRSKRAGGASESLLPLEHFASVDFLCAALHRAPRCRIQAIYKAQHRDVSRCNSSPPRRRLATGQTSCAAVDHAKPARSTRG